MHRGGYPRGGDGPQGPSHLGRAEEIRQDGVYEEEEMHTDGSDEEGDDYNRNEGAGMDEGEVDGQHVRMFPWAEELDQVVEEEAMDEPIEEEDDHNAAHEALRAEMERRNFRVLNLRGQLGGLPEFVRMLLPMQAAGARERRSNEDLIRLLKRNASISDKGVIKAFQVCSRDIFVPEDQRHEAFHDHPLRLDHDFNISAPHMHACMLQGLHVEDGDEVLDIGSGCGVTTAMLAYLTGKRGRVLGVELRESALSLADTAMATMLQKSEYVQRACHVDFEHGNAFLLPHHEGCFDKVHVGGLCTAAKVPALLRLLKPAGGKLVVPSGPKLLCITKSGSEIHREVLADVRFGELETPSDAEIVMKHLDYHRRRSFEPEPEPAGAGSSHSPGDKSLCSSIVTSGAPAKQRSRTVAVAERLVCGTGSGSGSGSGSGNASAEGSADVSPRACELVGRPVARRGVWKGGADGGKDSGGAVVGSYGCSEDELEVHSLCTCASFGLSSRGSLSRASVGRVSPSLAGSPPSFGLPSRLRSSPSGAASASPPRASALGAATAAAAAAAAATADAGGVPRVAAVRREVEAALGPPDCVVCGTGFALPAHAALLQARCPLFAAQFASGMRDAAARSVTLPPHFSEPPVRACLDYLYTGCAELDEDTALPALAVAVYLDVRRLIALATAYAVGHVRAQPVPEAVDAAAQLHVFASEHGLDALARFCAAFLAVHVVTARARPAWKALGPRELDEVLAALATERELVVARLESLSTGLPSLGP